MEDLSPEDLNEYLIKKGMDPDLAGRLKAERINGDVFLTITAEVLRACDFKAGEIVLISKYIKMPYEKEQSGNNTSMMSSAVTNDDIDLGQDENGDNISEKTNNHSDATGDPNVNAESESNGDLDCLEMAQHAEVSEYFSPSQFDKYSVYEKNAMYAQLRRYKAAIDHVGLSNAVACKPHFVSAAEEAEKKSNKKAASSSSASTSTREMRTRSAKHSQGSSASRSACDVDPSLPSMRSLKNSSLNKENSDPRRSSSCKSSERQQSFASKDQGLESTPDGERQSLPKAIEQGEKTSKNIAGPSSTFSNPTRKDFQGSSRLQTGSGEQLSLPLSRSVQSETLSCSAQNTVTASTSGSSSKSSNYQHHMQGIASTSRNMRDVAESSDSNVGDSDSGENLDETKLPFDLSEQEQLTGYSLKVSSMDVHLPKYDVLTMLNVIYQEAKDELKSAIRALKHSKNILPRLQRVRVMRALTLHLFNTIAGGKKATPDMKEGLAKSFVLAFNTYLLPPTDKRKPWALVYNRNGTGYLANTFRAPEKPFKKKKKTTKKAVLQEPTSEYDSDYIKELAVLMPDRSNKTAILDGMGNTFRIRNAERKRGLSVFDFVEKYPHFASYEGEALREEFQRLEPESRDMCREFARLLPEILKLQEKTGIVMNCDDDTLKGLLLISQHLPHDVTVRGASSWAKLEDVIVIMKPTQDIEAYAASKGEDGSPIQPYLIAVKAAIGKKITRTFLVLDRKVVQLASTTLKALDTLLKAYFVFNVCYPNGWRNTFHFLAVCFYKVFEKDRKRPDSITPTEHELFSKLGGRF